MIQYRNALIIGLHSLHIYSWFKMKFISARKTSETKGSLQTEWVWRAAIDAKEGAVWLSPTLTLLSLWSEDTWAEGTRHLVCQLAHDHSSFLEWKIFLLLHCLKTWRERSREFHFLTLIVCNGKRVKLQELCFSALQFHKADPPPLYGHAFAGSGAWHKF